MVEMVIGGIGVMYVFGIAGMALVLGKSLSEAAFLAFAFLPGDAIKASGNLGVQVRSKSDATLFSNQLALNVAEPPAPAYRFIGLITNKNGAMAVLKSQADESDVINVRRGEKFGTHWRVVNITSQKIDIEDMNLKIVHTINFTGENG